MREHDRLPDGLFSRKVSFWHEAHQLHRRCDVRYWHKADMQTALTNVCFEGNNGHDGYVTPCFAS